MLRGRASSVFSRLQFARYLDATNDYEDAKMKEAKTACGIKVERQQAWGNSSQDIHEVDDLLMRRNDKARHFVREVHPELCFWALNRRVSMATSKKENSGFEERMRVLKAWLPGVEIFFSEIQRERLPGVERDDIADAIVSAVTALADPSTLRTVPESPPLDDFGLPMEMVYADPGLLSNYPLKAVL